jgi:hypothetical protein
VHVQQSCLLACSLTSNGNQVCLHVSRFHKLRTEVSTLPKIFYERAQQGAAPHILCAI